MRHLALLAFLSAAPPDAGDGLSGTAEVTTEAPPSAPAEAAPTATEPPPDFPDLSGIPVAPIVATLTTADEVRAAPGSDEPECKAKVDPALRAMVFRHYENFRDMLRSQGQALPDKAPDKASHLLGMVIKESAGDTTDVTDMSGREVGTFHAMSSVDRWNALFSHGNVVYDKQTNYGLAQQSMDRILAGGAVGPATGKFFRGGNSGQNVRKLLAVYQNFAQGQLTPKDKPIPEARARDPKASADVQARFREGLRQAVWHCGTRFLFKEGYAGADGEKALEDAMATIAYCNPGAKSPNPNDKDQARCFARWVTLCPALNIDIAVLSPDSYFQTRNTAPLCLKTFQALTKPVGKAK
jgi:hypothetical protein